jgi:hypothetical protein
MRETLGVHEFARLTGRHFNTVYNWIRSGGVAAHKQNGEWRIPGTELDRVRRQASGSGVASGIAPQDLLSWWSHDFEHTMRRLLRLSDWMGRIGRQSISRRSSTAMHVVAESHSVELSELVAELREVAATIEAAERLRPRLLELQRRAVIRSGPGPAE